MTFLQFFRLSVTATFFVNPISPLYAQSGGVSEIDSRTAITSLTNLNLRPRDSTPFGSVDASASDRVELGVSGEPGLANSESTNPLQFGFPSAPLRQQSSLLSGLSSANVSQSSSWESRAGTREPTFLGTSTKPIETLEPVSSLSSYFPDRKRASKPSGIPSTRELQPFRIYSAIGVPSSPQSGPDTTSGEPALGFSSDDATASSVKASADDSNSTGADQAGQQGFFETVEDPFARSLDNSFQGFKKNLGMEQICGDACIFRFSGQFETLSSGMPKTGRSVDRLDPNALRTRYKTGSEK